MRYTKFHRTMYTNCRFYGVNYLNDDVLSYQQVERSHSNIGNLPDGINLTCVVRVVFLLMTAHHRASLRIRNLRHVPFMFTESTNCLPIMY